MRRSRHLDCHSPAAHSRDRSGTCSRRPLDPKLDVVRSPRPILTTVDEFYKVGPGPSSSHTIGPMRITYDFYQHAARNCRLISWTKPRR